MIKSCNIQECENRHPRFCYYQKYYGRCKFTTFCKYSHEEETILCENIDRIVHLEQKQAEKDLHIINLENRLSLIENEQKQKIEELIAKLINSEDEIKVLKLNFNHCADISKLQEKINPPSVIHQNKHAEARLYSCDQCEFITECAEDLNEHIEAHNANRERNFQFTCHHCDFASTHQEIIDAHIETHHEKDKEEEVEVGNFSCDQCDYETRFRDNLLVHKCDDVVIRYSCDQCDYDTLFQENLENHLCAEWRRDKPFEETIPVINRFNNPFSDMRHIYSTPYYT